MIGRSIESPGAFIIICRYLSFTLPFLNDSYDFRTALQSFVAYHLERVGFRYNNHMMRLG